MKPLVILTALLFLPSFGMAQTLTTPNYVINITSRCKDPELPCKNVSYVGTHNKTKRTIRLRGADRVRYCPGDFGNGAGATPCHHEGFEFNNGNTTYTVFDEGRLLVQQGSNVLINELGKWSD